MLMLHRPTTTPSLLILLLGLLVLDMLIGKAIAIPLVLRIIPQQKMGHTHSTVSLQEMLWSKMLLIQIPTGLQHTGFPQKMSGTRRRITREAARTRATGITPLRATPYLDMSPPPKQEMVLILNQLLVYYHKYKPFLLQK